MIRIGGNMGCVTNFPGLGERQRLLFSVVGRASIVVLISDSGEARPKLTPAAARASKGQHERSDEDLTEIAERRPEDLPATLIASCEKLRF